jgi:lipopolysaccharide transport system ATP-binding protein
MSPEPAVLVESISKTYRLGVERTALGRLISRGQPHDLHRALSDLSFSITPGEVVGVLGRNGAGKSTLLKILSRITRPDQGRVTILGRVGSLLEVGTGFHPELTGHENIFLNGAVLGMKRKEIARHFDDIVDFAGVSAFLGTPVKRYSSGMYVRLAFAVAAYLETEVLLVDEVLAVGDAQFQARCLGRMRDVSQEGRTVLFVSHNHVAIEALCPRSIYLKDGSLAFDGPTREALGAYLSSGDDGAQTAGIIDLPAVTADPRAPDLEKLVIAGAEGRATSQLLLGESTTFTLIGTGIDHQKMVVGLRITTELGVPVLGVNTAQRAARSISDPTRVVFGFDRLPLTPGAYRLDVAVITRGSGEILSQWASVGQFFVEPADVFGTGYEVARTEGPLLPDHFWLG